MNFITRKHIIKTARKWIGTQFHHQGRLKKNAKCQGGCDCLGLIIGIAKELNIQSKTNLPLHYFDQVNYSLTIEEDLEKNTIYNKIQHLLVHKETLSALPGDILLIKIHHNIWHFAILSYHHKIIHTSTTIQQVTEHKLFPKWYHMIAYVFSFPFIYEDHTNYPTLYYYNTKH